MSSWSPLPHATCLSCQLACSTDAPRLFSEIVTERNVGSLMPTTLMAVPGRHESSGGCRVRVHLESCGPAPCEAVMWVMGKGLQAMQCLWWKCWFYFRLCEYVYVCVCLCKWMQCLWKPEEGMNPLELQLHGAGSWTLVLWFTMLSL